VNRFLRAAGEDSEAIESLAEFNRFPAWMWRNVEVLDFIRWLREYNDAAGRKCKTGFYGLDLYSLYESIDAVIAYLQRVDPKAADRARERYGCLERFEEQPQAYSYSMFSGLQESCRNDVLAELLDIQRRASQYAKLDGGVAEDEYFYAAQNARIVAEAERYYGTMLDEEVSGWNIRDTHMVDTLVNLTKHLSRYSGRTKAVVWAHNSHVGNAGATSMGARHEINIGSLMRERFGDEPVLVGFTTYTGTVTAASDWDAPEERKRIRRARPDSYEAVFHGLDVPAFYLDLRAGRPQLPGLPLDLRERAIGVIYRPQTELVSHYFHANLLQQFDAVFHFDETRALEPLERTALWEQGEVPETYPTGV
jgi:erythromycin esterase-like protein